MVEKVEEEAVSSEASFLIFSMALLTTLILDLSLLADGISSGSDLIFAWHMTLVR